MKMGKVSCNIIKDMLPLYYDHVCSNDSQRMVEEHLSECDVCKRELERIQDDITPPINDIKNNRADGNVIKKIASSWEKSRLKSFVKGGIIGVLLITFIVLGYMGLSQWDITKVSTDVVEINNISELEDGKIIYHAKITDGYSLKTLKYDMDKEGNFYITPLRPILREKSQPQTTLENGYDYIDIKEHEMVRDKEIKKIFYGTPKDKILIWEKGMELPKPNEEATEELEKYFGF